MKKLKKFKNLILIVSILSTGAYAVHSKSIKKTLKGELLKRESIHIIKNDKGGSDIVFKTRRKISGIIKTAKSYLGTRYRYGGTSRKGMDCSGFTKTVMKKHGKTLPRTSRSQASSGKHIAKKDLKAGDLVFFSSKNTKNITHVGIALGNGKFIHASSSKKKVVVTSLSKKYYVRHYKGARRV